MGWLCDARGRKLALAIATIMSMLGGALQAGSVHIAMYLVARFIGGLGSGKSSLVIPADSAGLFPVWFQPDLCPPFCLGMLVTLIPIYQSEISPPASRGFLVAMHGKPAPHITLKPVNC